MRHFKIENQKLFWGGGIKSCYATGH